MKIFLSIHSLGTGGAERVITELANRWAQMGHDVKIITLQKHDENYALNKGISIINLGYDSNNKKTLFKAARLFRQIVKIEKPSFVLSFVYQQNLFTLISLLFLNTPIYISERCNPKSINKFFTVLRMTFYRRAKKLIVQTERVKKITQQTLLFNRIDVIPNPVKQLKSSHTERENIILNVGRFIPSKNQLELVEIFSKLNENNWTLVFVGDGFTKASVLGRVKSLHLENRVKFVANTSDVDYWYSKAKIFAYTSLSEGFPNVILESLASKLAVISYNFDYGADELIKSKHNGILVQMNDKRDFIEKLNIMIENDELRNELIKEADDIKSKYDISVIIKKWNELLNVK